MLALILETDPCNELSKGGGSVRKTGLAQTVSVSSLVLERHTPLRRM